MIEGVLHNPLFRDKERITWQACFSAILLGIWQQRNNRIFRKAEKFVDELWDFARFNSLLGGCLLSFFLFVNSS